MAKILTIETRGDEVWARLGSVTEDGADFANGASIVFPGELAEMLKAEYARGVEDAAKVCDRCSKPEPNLKGARYHIHVGSVTTAAVLATTIRALLPPSTPAPGDGVK